MQCWPRCNSQHCTALHCTALDYIVLHCTTLQCTVLQCHARRNVAMFELHRPRKEIIMGWQLFVIYLPRSQHCCDSVKWVSTDRLCHVFLDTIPCGACFKCVLRDRTLLCLCHMCLLICAPVTVEDTVGCAGSRDVWAFWGLPTGPLYYNVLCIYDIFK